MGRRKGQRRPISFSFPFSLAPAPGGAKRPLQRIQAQDEGVTFTACVCTLLESRVKFHKLSALGTVFEKLSKAPWTPGQSGGKRCVFEFMRGKCAQGLGENCSCVGENRPTACFFLKFEQLNFISQLVFFFFEGFQNLVSRPITQRINENVSCTTRKSAFVHPRKGFFCFLFFCFSGVNSAVRIGIQKNEDGSFTNKDEAFKTSHLSDAILDLIACRSRKVGVTPLL